MEWTDVQTPEEVRMHALMSHACVMAFAETTWQWQTSQRANKKIILGDQAWCWAWAALY
jgi:hypothetical protein